MQAKQDILKRFRKARLSGVPLVAVATPDPAATVQRLREAAEAAAMAGDDPQPACLQWEPVGFSPLNEAGKGAMNLIVGEYGDETRNNPTAAAEKALNLPEGACIFLLQADRWFCHDSNPDFAFTVAAIWRLRDRFKADQRTLVLIGHNFHQLPPELAVDTLVLDEPLPDGEALTEILRECHAGASVEPPADLTRAVEAVQGLSAFAAEQAAALSLTSQGLDIESLWERKRQQVEQTPGLSIYGGKERFADIGGVQNAKNFVGRILAGNGRPRAIVFIDEIEKALAGASGPIADTSGVAQDQLGCLLKYMQDHAAVGCIFVGPPGAAKSALAKAAGNEASVPTIELDLGGSKGGIVGQSEANIRTALKVITAISGGSSLWIATSNNITSLPPELKRRFTLGTFFFDLPTAEERESIWQIWLKAYGFALDSPRPDDEGWTGAEIRQCCDVAWRINGTLLEAAAFVVPVSRSAADQLERLRKMADGKFLSASQPGEYRIPDAPPPKSAAKQRRIKVGTAE